MILSPAHRRILLSTAMITLAVALAPGVAADVPPGGNAAALPPVDEPSRGGDPPFTWEWHTTGSFGNLASVDAVSDQVAWAVSTDTAEVLLTVDGGTTFEEVAPPEGIIDGLQFYDVEAKSADEALVLAAGTGPQSRIYRTTDGGDSWDETFRAVDEAAFFDCMTMFDENRGLAMGDPVNDKYQIVVTSDAGATWDYAPTDGMPDAMPGEWAWAVSGQCVTATGRTAWFGTGAGPEARVFRTADYGQTWTAASTGLAAGATGGIMALDFRTNKVGIAIGGDFTLGVLGIARTTDSGVTWDVVEGAVPDAYRTGISWWNDLKGDERSIIDQQKVVFTVGLTGSDVSMNRGKSWAKFDSNSLNAVDCVKGTSVCWASGGGGVIATLAVG